MWIKTQKSYINQRSAFRAPQCTCVDIVFVYSGRCKGGNYMGKKKQETLQDIIDRIEEDLISLREKAEELEENECECPDEDEDSDEDSD